MSDSRLNRLLRIVLRLRSEEWLSAQSLAESFGTSLRTIYRDIASLQKHGVPISGVPGPEGGYRLAGGDAITPLLLSSNEALTLFLVGAAGPDIPKALSNRTETLMRMLHEHMPPKELELLELARNRVFFDTSEWYWKDDATPVLQEIRDAVFKAEAITVDFVNRRSDKLHHVRIEPYGIVWKAGQWYVVGHLGNTIQRFRLDRIKAISKTGKRFSWPSRFQLKEWWQNELKTFGKGNVRVTLVVTGTAQDEMLGLRLKDTSEIERGETETRITLYVDNWEWLVPLVLSYGDEVRVDTPEELRSMILETMRRALQRYDHESKSSSRSNFVESDDSRRRATRGRTLQ